MLTDGENIAIALRYEVVCALVTDAVIFDCNQF